VKVTRLRPQGHTWPSPIRQVPTASSSSSTAPDQSCCERCSRAWGFRSSRVIPAERHAAPPGDISFIINAEPDSFGQRFAQHHGPSACAWLWRQDAAFAFKRAVRLDADPEPGQSDGAQHPAIEGIGGGLICRPLR
jgi:4-hydroxyphenylpyruvate dioxygenase-like putative hemolysin